ncbi:MAG: transglycosylase SLT domain-containing protein [Nitrospirales bacterium]|nr:transglycosylase SLT domain-containing protein [Nitrospirales bacterium]
METRQEVVKSIGACLLVLLLSVVVLTYVPEQPSSLTQQAQIQQAVPPQPTSHLSWLDSTLFFSHLQTRLPQYREGFEKAAQKHNIPWTLLAAQAYQESRWNRHAKSPTGVRGLMMLTRVTAASLGIQNRLDPDKSIAGGAAYFAQLLKRVSPSVQEPDRIWIALAAYNVGMRHIRDAQTLARQFKKDPYRWKDLKTVLPLLAKKKYYTTLRYGYARGQEPVQYVTRIQSYWDLLYKRLSEV